MLFKELFLNILSFTLAFSIAIIVVPPILRVAHAKKLFDSFNDRKIHKQIVPPLGGVGIFLGFVLSTIISSDGYSFDSLKYIIASVILMFFIGLKDDLMDISARKKFIIQIFAAVLLTSLGNFHISNLHGFLGFYQINYATGTILTLFIMIAIINAFNLIDGIDGLASGLGMLASFVFGTWFFLAGYTRFSIMSFALTGSLAGFFLYNVFGKKNKMFMGDTGSLIVGLIVAGLVIKFNEFNVVKTVPYAIGAAPAVSFAIVIVPLIDTLRVITIRLLNGKSPFSADKNHIHHRLLELAPHHLTVTLIILAGNIFIIGLALLFNNISFNVTLQFLFIFLTGIALSLVPSLILRWKKARSNSIFSLVKQVG
ncbi:MAG: MraY family glycosyltransferase [Mariniphaga sp.]|jgi:UDP-N-acetylmuramyl pentapeptide phosphotransferase/UDP-N-acetylglucosamine-1-phosphate transferase|nr:MraY family glycosyltransferase [Mariniphaga sp.]